MQTVPMQQVPDPRQAGYGAYPAYAQPQYGFPGAAFYGQYPAYAQFPQQVGGYRGGRGGRGASGYTGPAPYGRGAYGGGMYGGMPPMGFPQGYGRGGPGFGMRARRKKPFVGGSLDTQRQWEQDTLCCFFVQGQCKFSEGCRFSHDDDGLRPCQFGNQCRVGHNTRGGEAQPAEGAQAPEQEEQVQES